ncbi:MAG: sugar phosphate nucleotidyltransferase [Propionibacteriaceae bacterium]|nr:sugar phosphate nucleotidyltransferase [Propionibacteriaceae bacterium]
MRYVVILAGGAGTRLWPLSRQGMPKQLLSLFEGKSLLRLAYERLVGMIPDERILVCTGADYLELVARQLPELPPENLLGEPVGRDSLNAAAWSSAVVAERDAQAVVALVTADHLMHPIDAFQSALDAAFRVAEEEPRALVTLGVVPTEPHTGFGYLHRGLALPGLGACRVAEFKEKPPLEVAQQYLDSGEYWWNSGMFVWRTSTLLGELGRLVPETKAGVEAILADPSRLAEVYETLPRRTIDYAIMEPVSRGGYNAFVAAVPLAISWRDVGGYASFAQALGADEHGNAGSGVRVNLDSSGCLVINAGGPETVVATLGLKDTVVVSTPDAVLVASLAETERVKQVVDLVRAQVGAQRA